MIVRAALLNPLVVQMMGRGPIRARTPRKLIEQAEQTSFRQPAKNLPNRLRPPLNRRRFQTTRRMVAAVKEVGSPNLKEGAVAGNGRTAVAAEGVNFGSTANVNAVVTVIAAVAVGSRPVPVVPAAVVEAAVEAATAVVSSILRSHHHRVMHRSLETCPIRRALTISAHSMRLRTNYLTGVMSHFGQTNSTRSHWRTSPPLLAASALHLKARRTDAS